MSLVFPSWGNGRDARSLLPTSSNFRNYTIFVFVETSLLSLFSLVYFQTFQVPIDMDPRARLAILYEDDMQAMELDTRLRRDTKWDSTLAQAPGVSSFGPDLEPGFDLYTPVMVPPSDSFDLSYIRTFVVGMPVEDDRYLTELDQDTGSTSGCDSNLEMEELSQPQPDDSVDLSHMSAAKDPPDVSDPASFTPAVAMARYAVKYCSGDLSKIVSARFFNGGQFWNRTWDLYHLPAPSTLLEKPLLLIPTTQAKAFLDEINEDTHFRLTLTGVGKQGLVLQFTDRELELFRPVYLGRSSNLAEKDRLLAAIPPLPEAWTDWSPDDAPSELSGFELKVKDAVHSIKIDRDAEKRARKAKRDNANKKLEQCLGRVAAYFGLRPALQENVVQPSFSNGQLKPIDPLKPAPFQFQNNPIFISLDTEWMEDYGTLTEVGISVLDTKDLQGFAPGNFGQFWLSQIRTRHLRVEEYKDHVNMKYQIGCPDYFHHGESEFVPSALIANVVNQALSSPAMVESGCEVERAVILVGLNLKNDIDILRRKKCQALLNLDPSRPPPCSPVIHEVVDVAQLYRIYAGEAQPPGLANLLINLQIVGQDLHNAGNDAFHTLEALVRLMLTAAGEVPEGHSPAGSQAGEAEATEPEQDQVQAEDDSMEVNLLL
ncbi:unnamed protein product [Penicillium olsonii]|uniref:Gfd2/YDR514C-like C-terminal domain-containing protein n=1 Tax=Penicillium olsonii TaxID=99116 RepID=A0A9W4HDT2_PENOL|nr:unnamed protein product [Penicillium olsonii]CAG7979027.1 unnamed protein product [Penicillium olsonii]